MNYTPIGRLAWPILAAGRTAPQLPSPCDRFAVTNGIGLLALVTFIFAASHSSVVLAKRVARQPSSTDSVNGPE